MIGMIFGFGTKPATIGNYMPNTVLEKHVAAVEEQLAHCIDALERIAATRARRIELEKELKRTYSSPAHNDCVGIARRALRKVKK